MEEIKCEGKTIYLTYRQATTAKNSIKKYSHRNVIPKRAYHCKKCGHWHLTSKKNKPKLDQEEEGTTEKTPSDFLLQTKKN